MPPEGRGCHLQHLRKTLRLGSRAAGQSFLFGARPCNFPAHAAFAFVAKTEFQMTGASQIKEHMDVISFDRKIVGKVDHLEGPDKIKLTKESSPDGQHHHFIPASWIDHVDQHVHLNKTGADVTAHWQHESQS
jgi:hypothetical protein